MRYFTRSWARGELPDEEADEVRTAYWSRVEDIAGRLPSEVSELAKSVNLHDAIIRSVRVDRQAAGLRLELRCGDLQAGYFDAVLRYSGVSLETMNLTCLQDRARDPETEVLYDEVDIDGEGQLCHRFLFWPDGELEIRFASLAWDRVEKDARDEPRPEDVYAEGPIVNP